MLTLKQSLAPYTFICNPVCIPGFQILDLEANKCRGISCIKSILHNMGKGGISISIRPVPSATTSNLSPACDGIEVVTCFTQL